MSASPNQTTLPSQTLEEKLERKHYNDTIWVKTKRQHARRKSNHSSADTQPPNIAVVSLKKLAAICEAESFDVFMVDWRNLKNIVSEK